MLNLFEREREKLREMLFLSDLRTNFASDIDLFFKDLLKKQQQQPTRKKKIK